MFLVITPPVYIYRQCQRIVLVGYNSAKQAGITSHGNLEAMEEYVKKEYDKRYQKEVKKLAEQFNVAVDIPPGPRLVDMITGIAKRSAAGERDEHDRYTERFMGVIRAPILNSRTGDPESVFHCYACRQRAWCGVRDDGVSPLPWRYVFTDETFLDHIRRYGEIRDGKHVPRKRGKKRTRMIKCEDGKNRIIKYEDGKKKRKEN